MTEIMSYISALSPFVQALLANATVVGAVGWLAKLWADKQIELIRGDQARKLEETKGAQTRELAALKGDLTNIGHQFQAGLDQKMMVFKTHFELEFKSYRELWALCDDAANIAYQTLQYFQLSPVDDEAKAEEKADSIKRYDKCRVALDKIRKLRPFIAKEVATAATEIVTQCLSITKTYKDAYSTINRPDIVVDRNVYIKDTAEQLDKVRSNYERTADLIAHRISQMYVGEFGSAFDGQSEAKPPMSDG
jgi:hypothetical protein